MKNTVTLEEILQLAKQLSPVDKVRLIEEITPQIKRELAKQEAKPRKSLRGLWRGLDITDNDMTEMRQEIWHDFPHEDI
jgi:hypothetical protein